MTASTSRELTTIIYNSFGALQANKNFQTPLASLYPDFNCCPLPSFTKNDACKEATILFFQNLQLFTQCISILYADKSVLHYYV